MLNPVDTMTWTTGLALLAFVLASGFVVSWLATDAGRLRRTPYIGVLALATVAVTAVVAWFGDTSVADMIGHHWQRGLVAGVLSGLFVAAAIRMLPAGLVRHGHDLHVAEAWEGAVYGISEGVLLSGVPAFIAWQAAADDGWSTAASWAIALGASAAMIVVHHLGYWDYRGRELVPVVLGCLILTVGYVASGSLVAPALGHTMMHLSAVTKGVELPPHPRTTAAA